MPKYRLLLALLPLTLGAQPDATIHQEYRYQLPPNVTWTPVAGLPSGLRIIPESAEIWGAPNEAGQYKFALQANDGTRITLNLKVNNLWNLSLTPPQAAVGVAFSHNQVVGGGTPPYTFSATGLPLGLTISPNGLISGTPTKSGTYSATITATDRQGDTLTLPYKLSVNAVGIATFDLPPAEPGKPYSQQLAAAGGTPPYSWSLLRWFDCSGLGQHPVLPSPYDRIPTAVYAILDVLSLPGDLTPEGRLTIQTPLHYDQAFCVQVTDSAGSKAKSSLTVLSLEPGQSPLDAFLSPTSEEVSVGDPVVSTVYESGGTSPYTETPLLLPPGFIFYPRQSIVFGYPQTPGIHTIRIQVKDGAGAIVICETSFRASPIRVTRAPAGSLTYDKPFSQQFYAVNAAPPYSWALVPSSKFSEQLPAGLAFSPTGLLSGTPLEAGYLFPQGRITDAFGNSRSFGLLYKVSAGTPDTLDITSYDTPFLTLGRESTYALTMRVSGKAPFAWAVTGALPPGMVQQEDFRGNLTFWGVPSVAGSYPVTVRVTDTKGNAAIRIITLHVTPLHSDSRTLPKGIAAVMSQIQLSVEAGSPPYRWSLVDGTVPPGMTLSSSGVLSGIPSKTGYFRFTVAVTDGTGSTAHLEFEWQIEAIVILTPQALPPVAVAEPFSLQLEARGGAPAYTWSLQSPDCSYIGLTLSAGGLLSGAPSIAGYFRCDIVVTDALGRKAESTFSLYVTGDGTSARPQIVGPLSANISVGGFLRERLIVFAVAPYSVAAAPGSELPPGVTFDSALLSGFPSKAGRYTFEIQVTDAVGRKAGTRGYINVSPLHIVPTLPPGLYNEPYSYRMRTLEQVQPLLWTVAPTDRLPAGLNLSPDGLLSGVPAETGPFLFTVRGGDAAARVALTIDSGSRRTLDANHRSPVSADLNVPFFYRVSFDTRASARVVNGALPPGLELSPDGEITGTPATGGVYTSTIRVDAAGGDFGVAVLTIRVGVMRGETRTLPNATIGNAYTAQLRGGALAPGESLPPGLTLSLDGKLTGTPASAWLYKFSVVLTDATGDSVTSAYTLEVLSGT